MIPANQVAVAIVAACRETGEDPVACATPEHGSSYRARHYAMWALLHVHKAEKPGYIGALVGACPQGDFAKGAQFYNNSRNNALPGRRPGGGGWWEAEAYARVIAAVEAAQPQAAPAKPPEPAPYKRGPLPAPKASLDHSGGFRPAPGTYEKELADDDGDSVFDRGAIAPNIARRQVYAPPKSKREMMEDLRRAAENTAKQTPPPED